MVIVRFGDVSHWFDASMLSDCLIEVAFIANSEDVLTIGVIHFYHSS